MPDVDKIIAFENGEMDTTDAIDFIADLVKTGAVNHLQGFYGRTAHALISAGYISNDGNVLAYPE